MSTKSVQESSVGHGSAVLHQPGIQEIVHEKGRYPLGRNVLSIQQAFIAFFTLCQASAI